MARRKALNKMNKAYRLRMAKYDPSYYTYKELLDYRHGPPTAKKKRKTKRKKRTTDITGGLTLGLR